jgi:peptide chain release factor 1
MFDRLEEIKNKYDELAELSVDPQILSNHKEIIKINQEMSKIEDVVNAYNQHVGWQSEISDILEMIDIENDHDLNSDMQQELKRLKEKIETSEENLKILLLPKDPNDSKNVYVEVRGAAGGDEANIFANDLLRMYSRYADVKNWKIETIEYDESDNGGIKKAVILIKGEGAYSMLKYESGAHRVQRIPTTESGGRIHTSTATVAVLPEAEDVDIEIDEKDIKVDTYASGGAGGQSVNTTNSAVRLTHLPSNIVVTCQDERSQIKNREKALKVLKARIYDLELQKEQLKQASIRKNAFGTGDRSEKIRTYNYPQNRVTDHRINFTLNQLDRIMEGQLQDIIDALITTNQKSLLESNNEDN